MKDVSSLVDRLVLRYGRGASAMYYEDYSRRLRSKKYAGDLEKNYLSYSAHKYNHMKRWMRIYHSIDIDKQVSSIHTLIRAYDKERGEQK